MRRPLLLAAYLTVGTTLAAIYFPPFANLLQLSPFPPAAWLVILAIVTVTTLWSEPLKRPPQQQHGAAAAPPLDTPHHGVVE